MSGNHDTPPKYAGRRMTFEDRVKFAEYMRTEYRKKLRENLKKRLDDANGLGGAPQNKGGDDSFPPSAGAETVVVVKRKRPTVSYFI